MEAIKKVENNRKTVDALSLVTAVNSLILILKGETNRNTIKQVLLLLEKTFNYNNKDTADILSAGAMIDLCNVLERYMLDMESLSSPTPSTPREESNSTRHLVVLLSGFICSVSLSEESAELSLSQERLRATFLQFVLASFSSVSQESIDESKSLLVISALAVLAASLPQV